MKEELKESEWNENNQAEKERRGFKSVPKEKQKKSPLTIKVTDGQKKFLKDYCQKKEITISDLVRFMIFNHLKENGEDFSMFEAVPSNQTNLFD